MIDQPFDPFRDRLSRDIRNDLSQSLLSCLQEQRLQPAQIVAQSYFAQNLGQTQAAYIAERLKRYAVFLERAGQGTADALWRGLLLWELELYFEVHEILEQEWRQATGDNKIFLQAMIRAAGVYIKGEYGFEQAAASLAAKALPVLEANRSRLAVYTDPEALMQVVRRQAGGLTQR